MNRFLVIAMCSKTADYVHDWASKLNIDYHLQPPSVKTNHNVGEALSYFEYISNNYYGLANYTVFVDDAGPEHWHAKHLRPPWHYMVEKASPERFVAFGTMLQDKNLKPLVERTLPDCEVNNCTAFDELPCIYTTLKTLGVPYNASKHDLHAGNAFVVSREAIQSIPLKRYQRLVGIIRIWNTGTYCPSAKWGYALDRIKGVLWS